MTSEETPVGNIADVLPTLTFEIITPEGGLPFCLSDVDGLKIGWDTCGACQLHILICVHDVPVEPSYVRGVTTLRTDVRGAADYSYREVRSRKAANLNVMSLVDQDLVDQIKSAKERGDAADD